MYRDGEGVSLDYQQAMDWNMKAASAGNAEAQYNIGNLYYRGEGVSVDYKQAVDWFLKAANNGYIDAMNRIGHMYENGIYVTKSIPAAIEWYTKAANQGHAQAQYSLGFIYYYEDEVNNLQLAVNWLQKAAENNYYGAKVKVEHLNAQGYYAKEDEQEGNID
jgi:TPR repeat protein